MPELINPVNKAINRAAQRMQVEFPIFIELRLNRRIDKRFETASVEVIERLYPVLADSKLEPMRNDRGLFVDLSAKLHEGPPPIGMVYVRYSVRWEEGALVVGVTMQHADTFEVTYWEVATA